MQRFASRPRLIAASLMIIIVVIGAALVILLTPPPDPFAGHAVINPPFTPLTYSVQAFLWWDHGLGGVHLDWITYILGFSHVKHTFAWRSMETEPGVWDFSQSDRIVDEITRRDLKVIARLGQVPEWAAQGSVVLGSEEKHDAPPADLATWANYCATVATRYQGRIAAYQIWNEPNLAREWGDQRPDPAAYVALLAACSQAIRAADPQAVLISAGLAPTGNDDASAMRDDLFLDRMYRAGFQQYIDAVGVHATGYAAPDYGPDDAERDGRGRWFSFRRIEDLRKIMIAHDDAARQMAVLEFGWTTDSINPDYAWFAVSEEKQAQYIVEAYQYAAQHWRPWVGLMSLIYLPDQAWTETDEEWWWAITTPAGYMRPAFFSLAAMDRYCGDRIQPGWPAGTPEEVYLEQRITCP
jgi:polysaccharide biosynthesis protein PslG